MAIDVKTLATLNLVVQILLVIMVSGAVYLAKKRELGRHCAFINQHNRKSHPKVAGNRNGPICCIYPSLIFQSTGLTLATCISTRRRP